MDRYFHLIQDRTSNGGIQAALLLRVLTLSVLVLTLISGCSSHNPGGYQVDKFNAPYFPHFEITMQGNSEGTGPNYETIRQDPSIHVKVIEFKDTSGIGPTTLADDTARTIRVQGYIDEATGSHTTFQKSEPLTYLGCPAYIICWTENGKFGAREDRRLEWIQNNHKYEIKLSVRGASIPAVTETNCNNLWNEIVKDVQREP